MIDGMRSLHEVGENWRLDPATWVLSSSPQEEISVLLIREEFAAEGQLDAIALRVGLALDRHVEIDGAHDAVAEFLLDQLFPSRAVDLDQLEKR
jgi:hypothetical protein